MIGFFKDKPYYIMGIVNATPDSFSDGGLYLDARCAVDRAWRLVDEGADIIDIGGESTRPGACPVGVSEEQDRVLPVIEALCGGTAKVSVDTRHAATMRAAAAAGAWMVNDVTALEGDPDSMAAVAALQGPVCLMHMKGRPQTMQDNPVYADVQSEVTAYLQGRMQACEAAGIARDRLVIDPGIGFGKTLEHNLTLLRHLDRLAGLGVPVLLGASRKRFIGQLDRDSSSAGRLAGSLATVVEGYRQGGRIFRVHDVAETRQALAVAHAIRTGDC